MVCFSPVGYAATRHISQAKNIPYQPLLIKSVFSVLTHAEKQYFFKTILPVKSIVVKVRQILIHFV